MDPTSPEALLTAEETQIVSVANEYAKRQRKALIERFAGDHFPPARYPTSVFMAGSPGAGKTEFSKKLLEILEQTEGTGAIIRIDGDEIRNMLPGYTGSNSSLFQGAISIGVNKIHDYVLAENKSFILDGTFTHLERARDNIQRSIDKNRRIIVIMYVYQDPVLSWNFTQKREQLEGRRIHRDRFIEQFIAARQVVQAIKDIFGERIMLWVLNKNLVTYEAGFKTDVTKIDDIIPKQYSKEELESIIPL